MDTKKINIVYTKPQRAAQDIDTLYIDMQTPIGDGKCKLEYNEKYDEVEFECSIPKNWIHRIQKTSVKKDKGTKSNKPPSGRTRKIRGAV